MRSDSTQKFAPNVEEQVCTTSWPEYYMYWTTLQEKTRVSLLQNVWGKAFHYYIKKFKLDKEKNLLQNQYLLASNLNETY